MPAGRGLLRGVDRAAFVIALVGRLRVAGIAVDLSAAHALVSALEVCPPHGRTRLYWACRVGLVRHRGELAAFDAVFDAVFGGSVLALDPVARSTEPVPAPRDTGVLVRSGLPDRPLVDGAGVPWRNAPAVVAVNGDGDGDGSVTVPQLRPTGLDAVADLPFDRLDRDELARLERWLVASLPGWPTRRTRRWTTRGHGHRVDLRATTAQARRTGWETIALAHGAPVRRPRRVVLVCDVSESMRGHTTAYLHLMRACSHVTDAEAFAFSTRLTRLTPVLRHTSPDEVAAMAEQRCTDRFGGTRIATSLRSLLASHHGNALRGSVVVIASDGWDSDESQQLSAVMARLARRAHRVVWLNPRAGSPGWTPSVGAMSAAMPYVDALHPAHTAAAMREALAVIASFAETGHRCPTPSGRGVRVSSTA